MCYNKQVLSYGQSHINTTVIFMNESPRRNIGETSTKKDRYTAVLISQIIAIIILLMTYNFTVKTDVSARDRLFKMLSEELFTVSDIADTIKNYIGGDNAWLVSGDNVTVYEPTSDEYSAEEATNEPQSEITSDELSTSFTGMGGDDIEVYRASEIASFSPLKVTVPAISPIKNGRYTSPFGYRINPITKEFSFHTGLDIAAPVGSKIRAVYDGTVTRAGEDSRAGKYILIAHSGGLETFYCHCSEILAKVGSVIRQGETIATVGSTGWSTGPHLHFEVRKDTIRYNPIFIFER